MRWWRRGGVGAAGVKDRAAVPVQVRERCGEADRLGPFAGRHVGPDGRGVAAGGAHVGAHSMQSRTDARELAPA